MAKKKRPTENVGPTLSEQIEQQEQRKLLASAQAKGLRNLTASEKAAVARHEESTFLREIRGVKKTTAATLLGSSSKVICDNAERRGFPWPEGKRERVNVVEIIRWMWRYFLEHPLPEARAGGLTEEDVLLAGASQDLKDEFLRERIRERRIGNQEKQIKLRHLAEEHIPTQEVRSAFGEAATVISKKREKLERELEEPARSIVSRAFEDMAEDLDRKGQSLIDGDEYDSSME